MSWNPAIRLAAALFLSGVPALPAALGAGAILYKSGPIQITADGQFVWCVNPDHDSVSRIRTSDGTVARFLLPEVGEKHRPRGLAITPDGREIWLACQASDRIVILDAEGAILDEIRLRYGAGPVSVAVSPGGTTVVAALHGSNELAIVDVATRQVRRVVAALSRQPLGIVFTSATEAWISHTISDGEDSHVSLLDLAAAKITAHVVLKSVNPKDPNQIRNDPDPIPEGGYVLLRGHLASPPGTGHLWIPLQYQNFHNSRFTPDSTVQAAIHKLDLTTRRTLGDNRVVLTAVWAHRNDNSLVGPGWNAKIAGPVDIGFSADGRTAYLVNTHSDDLLVFPTGITLSRPEGADPLPEIPVGHNPIGLAVSPVAERAYVLNYLSRDVSVIDLVRLVEERRIATTPDDPEPLPPEILRGARLFHTSADGRLSANAKVACASCHADAHSDGLTWAFAQFRAGQRKTLSLRGLGISFGPPKDGRGQLHRSGDRDEVQDFEFTARSPLMGGTGFLTDPNPPLGAPNAGRDGDLDALATYLLSLPPLEKSPYREVDGALSQAARRGGAIFKNSSGGRFDVSCARCHTAPNFTDLAFHDVGGFAPPPEYEGPLFNTPTLVGAWANGPFVQAVGAEGDAWTLGGVVRDARSGEHGNTSGLDRTQLRDLAAFVSSIDGRLWRTGIADVADRDPPRVVEVLPVSLKLVDVIFSESVDPQTASDPAHYAFTDGWRTVPATAAVLDTQWGNRVRVSVDLSYHGCEVRYTLLPGPVEDLAGAIAGGANNVLDVDDPANRASFTLDGAITVTFGDTGLETFGSVARDAGFIAGLTSWSHTRWHVYPHTSPEMKGFVSFDFVPILRDICGVARSADILDARFTGLPQDGYRVNLEIRRCLMPWGEPPRDWCQNCTGAVTVSHSTYPSIAWHTSGARALGGSGTTREEYYPRGRYDLTATVDATATIDGLGEPIEFAGASVTDAFRFWFDNPDINFGYAVEVVGNPQVGATFWGHENEDGVYGPILSITYRIAATPWPGDLDRDSDVDQADLAILLADFGCTKGQGNCPGDTDEDGDTDLADLATLLANFGRSCH